ncbi:MAG: glycosyltransferase family 2 protein [Candidatus Microgenomates bacterium]
MKIAVIILHYGRFETTKNCLYKLRSKIDEHQLILINNSPDDITSLSKIIKNTILIDNRKNLGFAKSVNQGIARGLKDKVVDAFFLMNNDSFLSHGGFNQLSLVLNKIPSAGIVTPILHHKGGYDWGGKYNKWTGMVRHKNWINKPKTIQSAQHVAGAAMLIKRKLIEKVGLFDERFFLYFEDLDYCLRAHDALFTIHINPGVIVEHTVSAGTNSLARIKYQWISHLRFVNKYLFKNVYPTAYFFTFVVYPLLIIKNFIRR